MVSVKTETRRDRARRRISTWLASLQLRAIIALAVVVVAPLVFVWLSEPYEAGLAYRIQLDLDRVSREALRNVENPDALEDIARRNAVRLRVVQMGSGEIRRDLDFSLEQALVDRYVTMGLSPAQRDDVSRYDEELLPVLERPSVAQALSGEPDEMLDFEVPGQCILSDDRILLICDLARPKNLSDGTEVMVHVQSISPRAIRSLYDARYQLLVLAIQVSIVAMIMGIWLGFRVVRPVNQLREQVWERSAPPVSTSPIEVPERRDEVAELAHAFNALLAAIEESRKTNLSFMADVAHEIKNPIAAVRACAESLERAQPIDEVRAARMSRALKTSSDRMAVMITRFLELARAEAGLPDEQREVFAFDTLVYALIEVYRCDERYRDVVLEAELEPVQLWAAPGHMETVVRNLVENAVSMVGDGGRVSIGLYENERSEVIFSVTDNGPGVAPEDLSRIFDRFFTRRADGSGTGLGLAMTRAIVQAHRGHIEVQSKQGEGAKFTVILPTQFQPQK